MDVPNERAASARKLLNHRAFSCGTSSKVVLGFASALQPTGCGTSVNFIVGVRKLTPTYELRALFHAVRFSDVYI